MTFVAQVVDNQDPDFMGRLKIRIKSVHDGVSDADLPWAMPKTGSFGKGSTDIPSIGERVYVDFQEGDYHEPQYSGNVIDGTNLHSAFKTNYPNRKGFVSQSGMIFYRDESNGNVHFSTPSGITININNDNLTVSTSGNITLNVTGNITMNVGGVSLQVTGTGVEISGGNLKMIDGKIKMEGNDIEMGGGDIKRQGGDIIP